MRVAVIILGGTPEEVRTFTHDQRLESFHTPYNKNALTERMRRGHFKVIHSLGKTRKEMSASVQTLRRLHDEHRYTYYVVDMLPRANNNHQLIYALAARDEKVFRPKEWQGKLILDELEKRHVPIRNFEEYSEIVHIGDIHGHAGRLEHYFGFNRKTGRVRLDPRKAYVFHGDYFNKGPDNVRVFLLIEQLMKHKNVFFLWGNHENALHRYAQGYQKTFIPEFDNETRGEFEAAGITPRRAEKFMRRLQDVLIYRRDGMNVVCSHAGLYRNPIGRYMTVPSREYRKGADHEKRYYPAEERSGLEAFYRASFGENWLQIHGHSNPALRPINDPRMPFALNLNGNPESGGHVRGVEIRDWDHIIPRYLESESDRKAKLDRQLEMLKRDCGVAQGLALTT